MLLLCSSIFIVLSSPGTIRLGFLLLLMSLPDGTFFKQAGQGPRRLFSTWMPGYLVGGIIFLGMAAAIWSYSKGYQDRRDAGGNRCFLVTGDG
jgi:hypothetical protein